MGTTGEWVTVDAAARLLRVTRATIFNYRRRGLLVSGYRKDRKTYFRRVDVLAIKQTKHGTRDIVEVSHLATRALAQSEQCERKLNELLGLLGLTNVALDTSEKGIRDLYERLRILAKARDPLTIASQVFHIAKSILAVDEAYLQLVAKYVSAEEPWDVFLAASNKIAELMPVRWLSTDPELAASYGYLNAARRHIRSVAYFYVRAMSGKRAADATFIGDSAFDPLIATLFPQ